MTGIGTIINVITVIIGGVAGVALKNLLPKRLTDTVLQGIALAVIFIGISGAINAGTTVNDSELSTRFMLLMILSLAIGAIFGELMRIEDRLEAFAKYWGDKFSKNNASSTFSQAFVSSTLIFCVGAMAIVGAIEDGVNKNPDILIAKSVIDGITAFVIASTLGVGVVFSAISVFLYQGLITLGAAFLSTRLPEEVILQMSFIGSILIFAIGVNLLKMTKIKVGNLLPSILIPPLYFLLLSINF